MLMSTVPTPPVASSHANSTILKILGSDQSTSALSPDTACTSAKHGSSDYTPQILKAEGDPCPVSGLQESYVTDIYGSWNLCNTNGGLGVITMLYDELFQATNSGSSSYNFYNWYLDTNEEPGHEAGICTSGGTNWYGADIQDYIGAGANSGIEIWCYGPGTTTGTSTAGVDVGFSAGSSGASASVGYSYSYAISDAPVYDQSAPDEGHNYLHWWTNVNEAGSSGATTFNSEPAGDFARTVGSGTNLQIIWQEARWAEPGYCVFGGWSCANAYASETLSSYYEIYANNPPL
jgi:hypothetical protein